MLKTKREKEAGWMKPVQIKSIIVPRSIKLLERVYPVELNRVFSERVIFDSPLVFVPLSLSPFSVSSDGRLTRKKHGSVLCFRTKRPRLHPLVRSCPQYAWAQWREYGAGLEIRNIFVPVCSAHAVCIRGVCILCTDGSWGRAHARDTCVSCTTGSAAGDPLLSSVT